MDQNDRTRPNPAPRQSQPVRRRRKKRKPPIKELAICALVIFLAGFLLGFLVRGFFIPKVQTPAETTVPPETTTPPGPQSLLPLDDWRMILVNGENPISEDFVPELTKLSNGLEVDKRCYSDLQELISACRAAGLEPLIASGHRTVEYQEQLLTEKIRQLKEQGRSNAQAEKEAAASMPAPGASEHHLGLAVDIVDGNDPAGDNNAVLQWLAEHCWEYGFILRYPSDKTDATGLPYEPCHFRYVGREVAADIHSSGLCLEEYLAQYQ